MDLEYFNSFLETVNHKSLTKASERLNLTQPALSKQIRKLEEYFEAALLKRTTYGVELTKAGEMVYKSIPIILDQLQTLKSDLKNLEEIRKLTLGTLPSLAGNIIPLGILKLEAQGIDTEVMVKNTSDDVYALLIKGEIDAAIMEQRQVNGTLYQKKLFSEPLYLVVHNNHKLSMRNSIHIEELYNEEFVLYPPNCTIRQSISEFINNLKVKTEVEFGDFLIGYVAAGVGVTVIPEIIAKNLGNPMVKAIPITTSEVFRHIAIMSHSKTICNKLYSAFTSGSQIQ